MHPRPYARYANGTLAPHAARLPPRRGATRAAVNANSRQRTLLPVAAASMRTYALILSIGR